MQWNNVRFLYLGLPHIQCGPHPLQIAAVPSFAIWGMAPDGMQSGEWLQMKSSLGWLLNGMEFGNGVWE